MCSEKSLGKRPDFIKIANSSSDKDTLKAEFTVVRKLISHYTSTFTFGTTPFPSLPAFLPSNLINS
jgi:hypothetical protein